MLKKPCLLPLLLLAATSNLLAKDLVTYRCTYERYSDGTSIKNSKKPFELTFVADSSGKFILVGNKGSTEVLGVKSQMGEGISFIEITSAGNVMTTVVDSKGASVHSRHTLMGGEVVPSQFYGQCIIQ